MRLLGDRVSRRTAWRIALDNGWETTFDAEYLAVAKLQADALVTIDAELATKADGVVPLAPVEALERGLTDTCSRAEQTTGAQGAVTARTTRSVISSTDRESLFSARS